MLGADLKRLIETTGPAGFYRKLCDLLNEQQVAVDDVSYYELARACGVLENLRAIDPGASLHQLQEASPGASTALFPIVTGELLARKVIEGYEDDSGWIADRLVMTMRTRVRNQRVAGFTALAAPLQVHEGHPYQDSTFEEKYVTTKETKRGRILSINEELITFDQTGEINRRARALGFYLRQERERTIIRAVLDTATNVYRPSGAAEALYATDGSNRNYVGVGNTTSGAPFDAAKPLVDWTDIDEVRRYRATEVLDDRVDGTARPILSPMRQILVPEALAWTARRIVGATEIRSTAASQETKTSNPVPQLEILSSPFIDEVNADDWYVGDFRRQFVWSEVWPVQTFLQRGDSEAAFERDVVLRVKARYYGGVAAVDTVHVTKVDGA